MEKVKELEDERMLLLGKLQDAETSVIRHRENIKDATPHLEKCQEQNGEKCSTADFVASQNLEEHEFALERSQKNRDLSVCSFHNSVVNPDQLRRYSQSQGEGELNRMDGRLNFS